MDSERIQKRTGEVIFRERDLADYAYIIEDGWVQISVERDDSVVVLSELGPGEILGEMAVIDQSRRTATATVIEDCELTVVTPQQIQPRIRHADPVVRALLNTLLSRYRSELLLEQGIRSDGERVSQTQSDGVGKIRFEQELIKAIEKERLQVVYQPIQSLRREVDYGFEALVRWEHNVRGAISPIDLVSLAEETELIAPLSRYVFTAAVEDLAELRDAARRRLFVSVNVSPKETVDTEFLNQAWDICATNGCRTDDIVLELTESIMVDIEQLSDWADAAKAMGFRLSIDDFGTGNASLEYLTRLVPDMLKIDQNLIRSIIDEPRCVIAMQKVIELAGALDMQVIAEGVESAEQIRILRDLGCDMIQGYEVGHPVTKFQAIELLAG